MSILWWFWYPGYLINNPWGFINQGAHKPKNQKIVMKKIRLGTNEKTKKCTYCGKPGIVIYFGKEKRTLCKLCRIKLNRKHQEVQVTKATFVKASEL